MRIMNNMLTATIVLLLYSSFSCALFFDIADTKTVRDKIKSGALVVDVRTVAEYNTGHYDGSKNIPLAEIPRRIAEFGDKDKPVIVYCRSGNRSNKARKLLLEHGYKDVLNGGGLKDMLKALDTK